MSLGTSSRWGMAVVLAVGLHALVLPVMSREKPEPPAGYEGDSAGGSLMLAASLPGGGGSPAKPRDVSKRVEQKTPVEITSPKDPKVIQPTEKTVRQTAAASVPKSIEVVAAPKATRQQTKVKTVVATAPTQAVMLPIEGTMKVQLQKSVKIAKARPAKNLQKPVLKAAKPKIVKAVKLHSAALSTPKAIKAVQPVPQVKAEPSKLARLAPRRKPVFEPKPDSQPEPVPVEVPAEKTEVEAEKAPVELASVTEATTEAKPADQSTADTVSKTVVQESDQAGAGPDQTASLAQTIGRGSSGISAGERNFARSIGGLIQKFLRYPSRAKRRGWSGTVKLSFAVRADGSLVEATIRTSSGYELLDKAAMAALERAAPFPHLPTDLKPVPFPMSIPLTFNLKDR